MNNLYTTEATANGKEGQVCCTSGNLAVETCSPKELGGTGQGTNPAQLFAAGYACCFQTSLNAAANRQHVDASHSTITSRVGIQPQTGGTLGFNVELHITLPGVEKATAEQLIEQAHQICPFSNATRGNIPVLLILEEQPLTVS